mgnify:CR=1 FL=1
MKYKIYTDGACSGNPGPGGWAAIILVDDKIKDEIWGSEKNTTNNKMELLAPIRAIQKFKKKSEILICLLYTSPSPRDRTRSRMPSSA